MSKPWHILRDKLPPEVRERASARAQEMLAAVDPDELDPEIGDVVKQRLDEVRAHQTEAPNEEPSDEDNGPCGSAMGSSDFQRALRYSYRVRWSEEDQEFAATCDEFPSLSSLEADQIYALHKLIVLVRDVLRDMRATGETPPKPGGRTP
jgi:hypothetical protein